MLLFYRDHRGECVGLQIPIPYSVPSYLQEISQLITDYLLCSIIRSCSQLYLLPKIIFGRAKVRMHWTRRYFLSHCRRLTTISAWTCGWAYSNPYCRAKEAEMARGARQQTRAFAYNRIPWWYKLKLCQQIPSFVQVPSNPRKSLLKYLEYTECSSFGSVSPDVLGAIQARSVTLGAPFQV